MIDYAQALANTNALAVFVAAVGSFMAGAVWYSKPLFAKQWMALLGWTDKDIAKAKAKPKYMMNLMAACFGAQLVLSFGFSMLLNLLNASGLWNGVFLGIFIALFFTGTTMLVHNLFEKINYKLFTINLGYNLMMGIIIGGVLGVWPR